MHIEPAYIHTYVDTDRASEESRHIYIPRGRVVYECLWGSACQTGERATKKKRNRGPPFLVNMDVCERSDRVDAVYAIVP